MKKKNRGGQTGEHRIDETWLIPYADLLTLLLALFIVLFSMSQLDAKKFEEVAKSFGAAFDGGSNFFDYPSIIPYSNDPLNTEQNTPGAENKGEGKAEENLAKSWQEAYRDIKELKGKLDEYINENGLSTQLETKLTESQLKIVITDHALFDSGSARVKPESRELALAIADMLAQYPDFEVIVAGHTDNVPIHTAQFESNWDLSAARALNFMKVLFTNENLDPSRFSSVGYGEYRPVASNDTPEGRAKNRRVEISIIKRIKGSEETISIP